jgi:large subunit ribosomal protein L14e
MSASIESPSWRTVEVGRLVLINNGPFTGRIAAIVEIISEKRVSVELTCTGLRRRKKKNCD